MKKLISLMVLVLILGLFLTGCSVLSNVGQVPVNEQSSITSLTKGEFDAECPAAPAVAGLLLEAAGVDNRYGTGKDGGNYIKQVANHMSPEADFDGVSKCDVIAYECAVAAFLNSIDPPAGVISQYAGILDPVASGATFQDNEDGTGTMYLTVLDLCGEGIEDLELADIEVYLPLVGVTTDLATLSAGGYWDIVLIDNGYGEYEIIFYRTGSVPYTRLWDVIVMDEIIEDDLSILITNPSDVYTLNITIVNGNPAYAHLFTITYFPGTGIATGTGSHSGGTVIETVSDILFDFDADPNKLSFKSVYPNFYTWYPSFLLEENGTLTFIDGFGADNVYSAEGTWSIE